MFQVDYMNNFNDLRIQSLDWKRQWLELFVQLLKQFAAERQTQIDAQQARLEKEKINHVHTKQLLNHEWTYWKTIKNHIKHDWIIIKKLISVLNKIRLSTEKNCELDFANIADLESLMWNLRNELKHTKSELERTAKELEVKTHLFDNLSEKYQNKYWNMSITFFDNDQKTDFQFFKLHALSTAKKNRIWIK